MGRYEGVDERVSEHLVTDAVSVGPYVLSGGELAAMVVADAVMRKLPGALGHADSAVEESFSEALGARPSIPLHAPRFVPRVAGARGAALGRSRAGAASGGWSRAAGGRPARLTARDSPLLFCGRAGLR